jgi:hypothetical protein
LLDVEQIYFCRPLAAPSRTFDTVVDLLDVHERAQIHDDEGTINNLRQDADLRI